MGHDGALKNGKEIVTTVFHLLKGDSRIHPDKVRAGERASETLQQIAISAGRRARSSFS
jgi:hypothetical protein